MEGSVEIDNGGLPTTTVGGDNQEEVIETRDEGTDGEGDQGQSQDQGGEGGKPTLTEKGTKLDPDPLTAAHQLLANERQKIASYERVLGDPALLARYAKESGYTLAEAKAELKDEVKETKKLFTPDRFKTADDVATALNEMEERHEKSLQELREENKRLSQGYQGINADRQAERLYTATQNDLSTIRSNYPELNPKDPAYDAELEKEIGDFYVDLDAVDPRDLTKGFKGKISLATITDRVMKAAGKAKQKGSQQAQTDIKMKQSGKVVTSTKGTPSGAGESNDPGTTIAQRIARATGNLK